MPEIRTIPEIQQFLKTKPFSPELHSFLGNLAIPLNEEFNTPPPKDLLADVPEHILRRLKETGAVNEHNQINTPKGYNRPDSDDRTYFHKGNLEISGNMSVSEIWTIIDGDLKIDGQLDFYALEEKGYDGNAFFLVTGDLQCETLINEWGNVFVVGGDLHVREFCFGGAMDTGIFALGSIKTKFYFGLDISLSFGKSAEMEYGAGYALPINYQNPREEAVYPKHDQEESLKWLGYNPETQLFDIQQELEARMREGRTAKKVA